MAAVAAIFRSDSRVSSKRRNSATESGGVSPAIPWRRSQASPHDLQKNAHSTGGAATEKTTHPALPRDSYSFRQNGRDPDNYKVQPVFYKNSHFHIVSGEFPVYSSYKEDGTDAVRYDQHQPVCLHLLVRNPDSIHSEIGGEKATTAPELGNTPHASLGNNRFRIFNPNDSICHLHPGMNGTILHTKYGLSCFLFRNCTNVTVDSIHIQDFGGMGYVVLPRCRDFTFRNLRFAPVNRQFTPYSCTVDAIHITGIGGKLVLEDCFFDGIGDDTLNVHVPVLRIKSIGPDTMELFLDKPNALFPKRWGCAGDILAVFDGDTLEKKAEIRIGSIRENAIAWSSSESAEIRAGDYVINTFFCPAVVIRRCVVDNSRSRFCIESAERAEIYENRFSMGPSKPPVYISSAFRHWGEAGIVENVSIHDNELLSIPDPLCPFGNTLRKAVWIRINDKESSRT